MHEYSIVRSMLDQIDRVAKKHEATSVERVRVRIGEQAGVEVDLLRSAYELAREGTICRRADLAVVLVPAAWECSSCHASIATGEVLSCPECSMPARLVSGDDIILERVELEVA